MLEASVETNEKKDALLVRLRWTPLKPPAAYEKDAGAKLAARISRDFRATAQALGDAFPKVALDIFPPGEDQDGGASATFIARLTSAQLLDESCATASGIIRRVVDGSI